MVMVRKQPKRNQHQPVPSSTQKVTKKKIEKKDVEKIKVLTKSIKSKKELNEGACEETRKVQRMTRSKMKEGLQMRPSPSPRTRKQVPVKANSASAVEKPKKAPRRKKIEEGPKLKPVLLLKKKVPMKMIKDEEVRVITDQRKRKGIKTGHKKKFAAVFDDSEVPDSQSEQNIEVEMMEDPQSEGETPFASVEVETSDPVEGERGELPSLTRRKSQEEIFDELKELKRCTPRRINLLRKFTEISSKTEGGNHNQDSSSSAEPFLDRPGKFCQTCKATEVEGKKKLRSCSVCSSVAYCDRECQRKDWPNHKKNCWVIPGSGYKPKKFHYKPVQVSPEDVSAPDPVKTPEKATVVDSSTPDNSPSLVWSIRSEVTQAPSSKRKTWRKRMMFDVDVDPMMATGICRKISFRDDLDDHVMQLDDEVQDEVYDEESEKPAAAGHCGLRM